MSKLSIQGQVNNWSFSTKIFSSGGAGSKKKNQKQVRFSERSLLHMYDRFDCNKKELFYNKSDRKRFNHHAAIMVSDICKILNEHPYRLVSSPVETDVIFVALNSKAHSSIEAEEIVGLENFIYGQEYIQHLGKMQKKTKKTVVETWHRLQELKNDSNCDMSRSEACKLDDEISLRVRELYKEMSEQAVLRARRQAEYAYWMSDLPADIKLSKP